MVLLGGWNGLMVFVFTLLGKINWVSVNWDMSSVKEHIELVAQGNIVLILMLIPNCDVNH